MTSTRHLTVDGLPHALDAIEATDAQRLRLVFTGPAPVLQDRMIYILVDGTNREPVRWGSGAAGGRELFVRRIY